MQTANSAACTLRISVAAQTLEVRDAISGAVRRIYPISTSQFGLGTEPGSLRTPLGRFRIGEKIGHDAPAGTVFRGRQPDPALAPAEALVSTVDDLILSRILWLEGIEPHNANTRERYIYIHGTNHESHLGSAASHGCIRMGNEEVIALFDAVEPGTPVFIEA